MKKYYSVIFVLGVALFAMACDIGNLVSNVAPSAPTPTKIAVAPLPPANTAPTQVPVSAPTIAPTVAVTSTATTKNLIVNGDAEEGAGAPDSNKTVAVPGWTGTGKFTAVQYGASGGFPDKNTPGAPDRGKNFFTGGPESAQSSAKQTISVANFSSAIDSGNTTYQFAGWLGGFEGQDDNATVTAEFMDTGNKLLGKATLGPVKAADRAAKSGFVLKNANGNLPNGTRTIVVTMVFVRTEGSYNDASVDSLSLTLTSK